MHRLSVVSKRAQCRGVVKVTRSLYVRRFATETTPPPGSTTFPPPRPKRRIFRRILLYTSAVTLGLYGAGTAAALQNERFHDFFVESVPLGERIVEFAEQQGWQGHSVDPQQVLNAGRVAMHSLERAASESVSVAQKWIDKAKEKVEEAKEKANEKIIEAKEATHHTAASTEQKTKDVAAVMEEKIKDVAEESKHAVHDAVTRIKAVGEVAKEKVEDGVHVVQEAVSHVIEEVKQQGSVDSEDVSELARKAEEALKSVGTLSPSIANTDPNGKLVEEKVPSDAPATYTERLPIGWEAPPGYTVPKKKSVPAPTSTPAPLSEVEAPPALPLLPLVAPKVAEFSSSEPILAQLASTIDNLAAFLKDNPSAATHSNAKEVIDTAEIDLVNLGQRLQEIKEEEKRRLEQKLEEQAREYSVELLRVQIDAQDRLDQQGEDWRKYAEMERQDIIQRYRQKLEAELNAQSEIINQRLKEEVIAQGIELQRRWIREIKIKVEEERGGRLAKLDVLAADLKRLSRVTLDNSDYLDENLRMHTLWSSIRAVNAVVQESLVRRPFREELRVLRHVALAGGAREDPVLAAALDTLEASDVPDVGVEPLADLTSWFTTGVAPRVSAVALVPDENAGVLSYLASSLLSSFRFQRKGFVQGNDVLSVLARAEYFMNEKDLDSAARELNQLKGPAKTLLNDWLNAARKRLEVLQALEVVQTQATLSSLLLI
ncbi:hypothetical protein M422DRAFT_203682 [Sphaerobolus stellatus SS14]|nr:hypothetical protein M422DRAFT_203682 [Sphaerobolus stellatus SS14]